MKPDRWSDAKDSKAAQNALQAELEAIYNLAPVGLCLFDTCLRYLRINERLAEINGVPASDHIGRTVREIVPELADQAEVIAKKIIETGLPALNIEFAGTTASQPGVLRTWLENWLPIKEPSGRVVAINVVAEEITWRKRAEKALREAHDRALWLARFPDENPDPVVRVSADGIVLYINPSAEELPGWTCDVGQPLDYRLQRLVSRAMAEDQEEQEDVQIGRMFYSVWVTPFPGEGYANVYGRDITERKRDEEALRRVKEEWERTFDAVPDLIAILDDRHRVVRANRAMAEKLGLTPRECVGVPCYAAVHGTDRPPIFCPHTRTVTDCREHTAELHEERLGGHFLVSTTPICDEQGRLTGSVHVARDITERKQMEENLRRSRDELELRVKERTAEVGKANAKLKLSNRRLGELNKELQDFAFIASHDLQEPLRKVRSFGDMLVAKCGVSLDETSRDYIARMQTATARMQNLLDSLLLYSRVTTKTAPIKNTDLGKSVEAALSNLEMTVKEKNACVEVDGLPTVQADRVQMIQLFQNLIGNALKYHRDGEAPRVRIYSGKTGDEKGACEILVEDNGIGFEEKYLDRIFLPFERLHGKSSEYEGVGMGLAICKKIVDRHGGEITARSRLGKGSTFIVTLPAGKEIR